MVDVPTATCPRCGARVHPAKEHCHNCGLVLVPADSTRPALRPGPGRAPTEAVGNRDEGSTTRQ